VCTNCSALNCTYIYTSPLPQVGTPSKASWHPAATGHGLTSEVLAANYLQIFKRAVVDIDSAAPGITLQQLQVTIACCVYTPHAVDCSGVIAAHHRAVIDTEHPSVCHGS
jgi:hypothetical protein